MIALEEVQTTHTDLVGGALGITESGFICFFSKTELTVEKVVDYFILKCRLTLIWYFTQVKKTSDS